MQTQKFQGVKTKVAHTTLEIIGSYHNTEVCVKSIYSGKVTLRTGGRMSATTKSRMNQFANEFCQGRFRVYTKNHAWFVDTGDEVLPFHDGMTV